MKPAPSEPVLIVASALRMRGDLVEVQLGDGQFLRIHYRHVLPVINDKAEPKQPTVSLRKLKR